MKLHGALKAKEDYQQQQHQYNTCVYTNGKHKLHMLLFTFCISQRRAVTFSRYGEQVHNFYPNLDSSAFSACRRYRSIAAASACGGECGQCHVVSVRIGN